MNDLLYGSKKYWYCPALSLSLSSRERDALRAENGPDI